LCWYCSWKCRGKIADPGHLIAAAITEPRYIILYHHHTEVPRQTQTGYCTILAAAKSGRVSWGGNRTLAQSTYNYMALAYFLGGRT
jgi:hypothetical protein